MLTDITMYTDSELSMLVFNDEGLYRIRHTRNFIDVLDEYFIYTDEQLDVLLKDLEIDLYEINA